MSEPLFGLNNAQELLLQTPDFTLLKKHRNSDTSERLFKVHRTPEAASLLAREFALLRDAALTCAPEVLAIEEYQGELALVMAIPQTLENGFRTLRNVIKKDTTNPTKFRKQPPFNTAQNLALMTALASSLEKVHAKNIVHCAITPEHILCSLHALEGSSNIDVSHIALLHFLYAKRVENDADSIKSTLPLPPDVRYIAPEQTGRVNRAIDYRTDLYALGCIFYELLTGKAPFEAGSEYPDTLAILHAHVAIEPIPPHSLSDPAPEKLSRLVMKLLKKNPDERYQSAEGLRRELAECTELWRTQASLKGFVVGGKDRSDTFTISQNIIGREKEQARLREVFEQAASGKPHLCLLGGYAGAGKTALVRELQKQISRSSPSHNKPIFLEGKFDQVKQNIPYSALLQCMEGFSDKIVSESKSAVEAWKGRILEAVGNNGRVLTAAFPALERVLGEQPPVQELGTQESQNRFRLVVERFVRVLARAEHPLVLFLDDMQWADSGTLSLLLHSLKSLEGASLLVICAYRSNEVDEGHPFLQTASRLELEGVAITRTEIGALSEDEVREIIAETLALKPHEVKELSKTVFEKTEGNPLFVVQLLQSLHRAGAIWFDRPSFTWKWRNEAVLSASVADNVVELLSQRLAELPHDTQRILQRAACVGNRFEAEMVSIIAETSSLLVLEALHRAQQAGLIQQIDIGKNSEIATTTTLFAFVHDRVQQAAYSMIPETERNLVHLNIARLWQTQVQHDERAERLFDVVGHYNKALSLVRDDSERESVALLNLAAARKAKQNTVFGAAAEYIKIFGELTHDGFWKTHYAMMREASIIGAEVGYAVSDDTLLKHHSDQLLQYGRTLIDRVQGEKVKIEAFAAQGRYNEAVTVGRHILAKFGVHLPQNSSKFSAGVYLLRLRNVIGRLKSPSLRGQEKTVSDEQGEVMNILRRFTVAAITGSQNLLPAILYVACKISLENGFVATSGYFFFIAGILMRSLFSENTLADYCLQAGLFFQ